MASMSPPASSEAPTPVKKPRGRPAGAGAGKKKKATEGDTPRATGAGRGRKKRQSTVDSTSASTPAGGLSMHTPGGTPSHAPSPGMSNIGSILENDMRNMRETSQFSTSRKGANKGDGTPGGRGETGTQIDGDEDEDEEDDEDDEEFNLGDLAYDEQAKERAEAKEALRCVLVVNPR